MTQENKDGYIDVGAIIDFDSQEMQKTMDDLIQATPPKEDLGFADWAASMGEFAQDQGISDIAAGLTGELKVRENTSQTMKVLEDIGKAFKGAAATAKEGVEACYYVAKAHLSQVPEKAKGFFKAVASLVDRVKNKVKTFFAKKEKDIDFNKKPPAFQNPVFEGPGLNDLGYAQPEIDTYKQPNAEVMAMNKEQNQAITAAEPTAAEFHTRKGGRLDPAGHQQMKDFADAQDRKNQPKIEARKPEAKVQKWTEKHPQKTKGELTKDLANPKKNPAGGRSMEG